MDCRTRPGPSRGSPLAVQCADFGAFRPEIGPIMQGDSSDTGRRDAFVHVASMLNLRCDDFGAFASQGLSLRGFARRTGFSRGAERFPAHSRAVR
jgi:hypothetical protein